ncbi:MAG: M14 family zinc carboxypeptidase, partial [Candidatus Neomarinimicrobiota bacterium]
MRSFIIILISSLLFGQIPLKYHENITPTYYEAIAWYKQLDSEYDAAKLFTYGLTDIGKPLHLFVISADKNFDPNTYRAKGQCMIMINNAIHPGEPCGVDASLEFAEDLLRNNKIPKNVIIGIIPAYNIGGVLNRNSTTRANQNGPEDYGFRGNARNLDLNRDFIKTDSENAKSITKIFHEWNPDFFIDTHTPNGADYQHIMTMISPNPNNFPPVLQNFVKMELLPKLYSSMENVGFPMVPYVTTLKKIPDFGIKGGVSSPRYSNGYSPIFNT